MQYLKLWQNHNLICGITTKKSAIDSEKKLTGFFEVNKFRFVRIKQIHSSNVILDNNKLLVKKADGLVSNIKNNCLIIRTADCVPLFFYEPKAKIIGLSHAGWKGSLKNIALKTILLMKKNGAEISNIKAYIGPHIKPCCYEIDENRVSSFIKKYPNSIIAKKNNRNYLSLYKVNKLQLEEAGILTKNISVSEYCTYCCKELFYSYRRDYKGKKKFLEMYSFIVMI